MNLRERLRLMPPGSLVPAEWVLAELEGTAEPTKGDERAGEDLTVQEIAERAKRSPSAVRGWIRSGQLRAYRFQGRDYRVAPEAWDAFKEAQRSGGEAKPRERSGKVDLGSWRDKLKKTG